MHLKQGGRKVEYNTTCTIQVSKSVWSQCYSLNVIVLGYGISNFYGV